MKNNQIKKESFLRIICNETMITLKNKKNINKILENVKFMSFISLNNIFDVLMIILIHKNKIFFIIKQILFFTIIMKYILFVLIKKLLIYFLNHFIFFIYYIKEIEFDDEKDYLNILTKNNFVIIKNIAEDLFCFMLIEMMFLINILYE